MALNTSAISLTPGGLSLRLKNSIPFVLVAFGPTVNKRLWTDWLIGPRRSFWLLRILNGRSPNHACWSCHCIASAPVIVDAALSYGIVCVLRSPILSHYPSTFGLAYLVCPVHWIAPLLYQLLVVFQSF